MKVDVSLLTRYHIARIELWLKMREKRGERCPFNNLCIIDTHPFPYSTTGVINLIRQCKDKSKCIALFPKIPKESSIKYCPCKIYSVDYVTKRAHYFIALWNLNNMNKL